MSEAAKKAPGLLEPGNISPWEHTCGVVDEREATMLRHLIMAEIRKSNAPDWVAEELEKKMDCQSCWRKLHRQLLRSLP